MNTIDAARAQRAREIFNNGLLKFVPCTLTPDTPDDSAEWLTLEATRSEEWDWRIDTSVKYSNTPHPDSVGADLPMRGIAHSKSSTRISNNGVGGVYVETNAAAQKRSAIALWPDKKFKPVRNKKSAPSTLIKPNAPRPDSAYSHLPLRGLGLIGSDPKRKWTLTAEEKRTLEGRPVRYKQTA